MDLRARFGSRQSLLCAAVIAAFGALFLILAWPGAAERGILGEEIQPFLHRYPTVLEWARPATHPERDPGRVNVQRGVVKMPPYEEGAPPRPRWVATSQWPVIAYDGEDRIWPVFIRGHQTALGSYTGILLGPLLGAGIEGPRRVTVLLGLLVVACTILVAFRVRSTPRAAAWAGAILAASFGMIAIARTAESFEVGSRAAMMIALAVLAPRGPPSLRRSIIAGVASGVAILCRGTIVVALLPALAVLLLREDSRPSRRAAAAVALLTVALPVLVVAAVAWIVPFRPGSAPLSGFPIQSIPSRVLGVPYQAVLTLAWLGDATSIWGPLSRGGVSLGPTLHAPAFLALIPTLAALYRITRGRAGIGERLFLATLFSSVVLGAVLYSGPDQFQLALAVEPMIALAVGEQLASIADRRLALLAGIVALCVRAHGAAYGLALDARNANPMLSGRSQRAAVDRLRAIGVTGPEVLTTVYNQAGVIEGWTGGALRPLHAWPVLSSTRRGPSDCALQAAWREILRAYAPRYVLVTEGPNLYESGDMDPPAIARSLDRVAAVAGLRIKDQGRFPTESGGPGWALLGLEYPEALFDGATLRELPADPACAHSEAEAETEAGTGAGTEAGADTDARPGMPTGSGKALPSFRGLRPGARAGAFVVERIEAWKDGARVLARRGDDAILLEIRPLDPSQPPPPATGAGLGVFYRNQDAKRFGADEIVRAAQAIAADLRD